MTGLEFASSLIDHLLWPLVVVAAFFLFRRPLSALIGRMTHYEGLGQRLDFGAALAEAEGSVDKATEGAGASKKQPTRPNALAEEADASPSFVIIQAWEELETGLENLREATQPGRKGLWNGRIPPDLVGRDGITPQFAKAVRELHDLRNRVAHGQSKPTAGEAAAYAITARDLAEWAFDLADASVDDREMENLP